MDDVDNFCNFINHVNLNEILMKTVTCRMVSQTKRCPSECNVFYKMILKSTILLTSVLYSKIVKHIYLNKIHTNFNHS